MGHVNEEQLEAYKGAAARAAAVGMAEARLGAPVFVGELAGGIFVEGPKADRTPSGFVVSSSIIAAAPHALVVEEGRTAGATFPPLAVIRHWVARLVARSKLDVAWTGLDGEDAIDRAAYVIAVSIHRKGIPPRKFMKRAELKAKTELEQAVAGAASEFVREVEALD
jgi:hypothetical protein